jgi:hypothetical protein
MTAPGNGGRPPRTGRQTPSPPRPTPVPRLRRTPSVPHRRRSGRATAAPRRGVKTQCISLDRQERAADTVHRHPLCSGVHRRDQAHNVDVAGCPDDVEGQGAVLPARPAHPRLLHRSPCAGCPHRWSRVGSGVSPPETPARPLEGSPSATVPRSVWNGPFLRHC